MFTAPCQELQMRLRRAQSSSSSTQRERKTAGGGAVRFHRLSSPRKRARCASGWRTCAWRRRDLTENTPASGQNCNNPPPSRNAPHRVTFHSTKLCALKAFYGHLAEAAATLSECNTRSPRVFSRGSPACASASCCPLILRSQVSETRRVGSAPLARGADAPNSGTGTITPGDTAGKVGLG